MKTRNGFVSNSSSSSFIIAIKNNNIACPCCGRKDPDLVDLIRGNEDSQVYSNNTDRTLQILEEYVDDWSDMKAFLAVRDSIKALDKNEWNVVKVSISNNEDILRTLLDNLVSSGNAKIIHTND